jgi:lysophospholipase L1-like esterase
MAANHRLTFVDPMRVLASAGRPEEFDLVERTLLAQGDSWFSIGAIPPGVTSNLLAQMEFTRSAAAVNCARPGIHLSHMSDTSSQKTFRKLLAGRFAVKWDAILFSGGGNDLIHAATVGPDEPPHLRLLATEAERGANPATGDDYVSDPGWQTFETHMTTVFDALVAFRDSGVNRQVPMVFHTYAHIMPRPAPVAPGVGPWLEPAMKDFVVPSSDWLAVSAALMDRLADLFTRLIAAHQLADPGCALHLVDSRPVPVELGKQEDGGVSGDFFNEIHPTRGGYTKLAAAWRDPVDQILQ